MRKIAMPCLAALIVVTVWVGSAYAGPPTLVVPDGFPTIQEALKAAAPGAIIIVQPGFYRESLVITKPLTLQGRPGVVLQGDGRSPVIVVEHTERVTVEGLTLTQGHVGITVRDSSHIAIQNNILIDHLSRGIFVLNSSVQIIGNLIARTRGPYSMAIELANSQFKTPSLIQDNLIARNENQGINLHMAQAQILGNQVLDNHGRGISVTEMSIATLWGNVVSGNGDTGIYLVDYSHARIELNWIRDTRRSGFNEGDGIGVYFYAHVELLHNRIANHEGHGVLLTQHASAQLRGNVIQGNGLHGLWMRRTTEALVMENFIEQNEGCGIRAEPGSSVRGTINLIRGNGEGEICGELPQTFMG